MEIGDNIKKKVIKLKIKKSRCPICKKTTTSIFMPFCSKKCSDLDLMKWLSDEYNFDQNIK